MSDDVREDFIDFPTAWELQRAGITHSTTLCSAVPHKKNGGRLIGGPAFLCDCGGLPLAWVNRCVAQRVARGEDEAQARADQIKRAAKYLVSGPS